MHCLLQVQQLTLKQTGASLKIPSIKRSQKVSTLGMETATLALGTNAPTKETDMLAMETATPALETDTAALETDIPALEIDAPAMETDIPAMETGTPAMETGTPASHIVKPTVITAIQSTNVTQVPSTGEKYTKAMACGYTVWHHSKQIGGLDEVGAWDAAHKYSDDKETKGNIESILLSEPPMLDEPHFKHSIPIHFKAIETQMTQQLQTDVIPEPSMKDSAYEEKDVPRKTKPSSDSDSDIELLCPEGHLSLD